MVQGAIPQIPQIQIPPMPGQSPAPQIPMYSNSGADQAQRVDVNLIAMLLCSDGFAHGMVSI